MKYLSIEKLESEFGTETTIFPVFATYEYTNIENMRADAITYF